MPPVNTKIMARKRGRANVVKDGEEGQEIRDIVEKGDDDDFVVGDINPDSDDDFMVDPKNHKKKSKSKIRKSSKSSVGEPECRSTPPQYQSHGGNKDS